MNDKPLQENMSNSIAIYLSRKSLQKTIQQGLLSQYSIQVGDHTEHIPSFGFWTTLALGTCQRTTLDLSLSVMLGQLLPNLDMTMLLSLIRLNFSTAFRFTIKTMFTGLLRMLGRGLDWPSMMLAQLWLKIQTFTGDPWKLVTWTWIQPMIKFMNHLRTKVMTRDACLLIDRTLDHLVGQTYSPLAPAYISCDECFYVVSSLCRTLDRYGRTTLHYLPYLQDIHMIQHEFYEFEFNNHNHALARSA